MVLADRDIRTAVHEEHPANHQLVIKPWREENLQPSGYDLTLSDEFLLWKYPCIITPNGADIESLMERVTQHWLTLNPGDFVLGCSREYIEMPIDLCGEVHMRSSMWRLGIGGSGYIDPGFKGQITLEIKNHSQNTIMISSGERIAQIVFENLCCEPEKPYQGRYLGQRGPQPSRLWSK